MLKITSNEKTRVLLQLAADAKSVPGDAAECGVYQGGNLLYLARAMPTRRVYGFDTFCGLPLSAWREGEPHNVGDFNDVSYSELRFNFAMQTNIILRPGVFPQSAEGLEDHSFAFVYIDFDYYISTRDAIAFFTPRMNPGGIMAFDDYEWPQCPGVIAAIEESDLDIETPLQHLAVAKFAHALA